MIMTVCAFGAVLSQCLSVSDRVSDRVSVCRIELFLLSDSQKVHDGRHASYP